VNFLSEEKKQQVIALGQLGWSLGRIHNELHGFGAELAQCI